MKQNERPERVIFLGVTGVLHTDRSYQKRERSGIIKPKLVNLLDELVTRTGAKIVLTSFWRNSDMLINTLKSAGVQIDDMIGVRFNTLIRTKQDWILEWLYVHPGTTCPVVLDANIISKPEYPYQVVHVDKNVGLTQENIEEAEQLLTNE